MRSLNLSAAAVSRWKIAVFPAGFAAADKDHRWAVLDKMGRIRWNG
jgi:hypothetical protein